MCVLWLRSRGYWVLVHDGNEEGKGPHTQRTCIPQASEVNDHHRGIPELGGAALTSGGRPDGRMRPGTVHCVCERGPGHADPRRVRNTGFTGVSRAVGARVVAR